MAPKEVSNGACGQSEEQLYPLSHPLSPKNQAEATELKLYLYKKRSYKDCKKIKKVVRGEELAVRKGCSAGLRRDPRCSPARGRKERAALELGVGNGSRKGGAKP